MAEKRVSAKAYTSLLRKIAQQRRRGSFKGWLALSKKAVRMRERLIAGNPRRHPLTSPPKIEGSLKKKMPPQYRAFYEWSQKHPDGRKVAKGFKEFWKLPYPTQINFVSDGTESNKRSIRFLMGMGDAPEVHLSDKNKNEKGKKHRTRLKGKWQLAAEPNRRHLFFLSNRPIKKPFKFVGYAPETNYIPSKDIEDAIKKRVEMGLMTKQQAVKFGKWWRHLHGENDSNKDFPEHKLKWPAVYADRNGKISKDSNFVYDKTPSAKVRDWMYG